MPSPNVIMVVLDTVRSDRVSCYGHDRETTPSLDAFTAGATRFADPVAQAPWSVPAHASLFTGAYPSDHGATTIRPILQSGPTLPEELRDAGYETYAVSPNEYVRPRTGFGRGFDEFHTLSGVTVPQPVVDAATPLVNAITSTPGIRRPVERLFNAIRTGANPTVTGSEGHDDDGLVDRVDSVLDRADDPFFLFCNLMDVHMPRSPAEHWFDAYVDDDLRSVPVPANERTHLFGDTALDEATGRKLRQLYDADLRTMDDRLGRLLATFERAGVLEDSLVVLVSDHGEHLGEFDLVGHQHSVLDPVVSVPLVIRFPGQISGRVVEHQVETRRVFHTILDAVGARDYPDGSLASGIDDRTAYGEFYTPMIDAGRLLWDGQISYDADLLGERLSFVRADGHKLVTHADEEWLFETPERPASLVSEAGTADVYETLAASAPIDAE